MGRLEFPMLHVLVETVANDAGLSRTLCCTCWWRLLPMMPGYPAPYVAHVGGDLCR